MNNENADMEIDELRNRVSDNSVDLSWWLIVRGILILMIGVFAISWPKMTVGILVKGFGAYLILDGLWGAVISFRSDWKNGGTLASLLGIALGAALLFITVASVRLFLALLGGWALIQGIAVFLFSQDKADPNARKLFGISGGALALAGLVLLVWPITGVVAVSWLLGGVGLVAGVAMIFVGIGLRKFATWVQQAG